jgi:hypothetical protein
VHRWQPHAAEGGAVKAIWAIVAGLGFMLVLSFVMVFVTMAHPPATTKRAASRAAASVSCNCKGQCMRKDAR